MRDLDAATRARDRGFITPEQLREAQQFAAGGRSVLSVLLDLGHLKADDLLRLGDPAPAPRASRGPFGLATAAALVLAAVGVLVLVLRPSPPAPIAVPPAVVEALPPPRFADEAVARARRHLADVEGRLDGRGRPPAAGDAALRRAAALLEESLGEEPRGDDLLVLARIRELLDEWEEARHLYRRGLESRPDDLRGLLGAARLSLLLQDPAAARLYADRACRSSDAPAEALFLRGAAALSLGERASALPDLAEASRLDASLRPKIEALRSR